MIDVSKLKLKPPSSIGLRVDQTTGYVYLDEVKIARFNQEKGTLAFFDKDKRRAAKRGSQVVEIKVVDLLSLVVDDKKLLEQL